MQYLVYIHIDSYMYIYMCMHVYVHIYVYICIYEYMHVCIYTHIIYINVIKEFGNIKCKILYPMNSELC